MSDTEHNPANFLIRLHPLHRFFLCLALVVLVFLLIPKHSFQPLLLAMILWIVFALSYNLVGWIVLFTRPVHGIKKIAVQDDGSKIFVFIMVLMSSFGSLFTVLVLMTSKDSGASGDPWFAFIAISGMLLSWIMVHTIFSFHYAHMYYDDPDEGKRNTSNGLIFPREPEPDYLDFAYFAFGVGCTFQVSDVQVTSPRIRRLVMLHSFIAFILNTFVVALTINLIAGLSR